jgi:hydrogenase nickel incorporation protein HypA/HybF
MHELSITRNVVAIVAEAAAQRRVKKVTLEVGTQAGVMTDAIAFCFDVVAKGTAVEGAVLDILVTQGTELKVRTMEVEEAA